MKTGLDEVDGYGKRKVTYKFISEDTIKCVDDIGNVFYTHYKSLVVDV